jgi:hypothetical protein
MPRSLGYSQIRHGAVYASTASTAPVDEAMESRNDRGVGRVRTRLK